MTIIFGSSARDKLSSDADSSRRRFVVGLASLTVASCGGGSGTTGTPPPSPAARLKMSTYLATPEAASATLENVSGSGISIWTNPANESLTQALFTFKKSDRYRIYYGPTQEVQRVEDESTGAFLTVTQETSNQTNYHVYNNKGVWQNGWAIIKNVDESYSTAQILNSSGLQGKQVTINVSGAVTASMSLLPVSSSGLALIKPLLAGTTPITLADSAKSSTFGNRILDVLIGSAYAASVASATRSGTGGALASAMGAVLLAGAGGALGIQLAGVAFLGYGAYQIYKSAKGLQDGGFEILDSASAALLDNSVESLRTGSDPIVDLQKKIKDYFSGGASALPTLSGVTSKIDKFVSSIGSSLYSSSSSAWQSITTSPPPGDTNVEGVTVDNQGNSYISSGKYLPDTGNISFQTNTVNGLAISGTANTGTQSGSYTATAIGGNVSGPASASIETLGACQTIQNSGGQGAFTKVYDLGTDSGTFTLTYEMYSIPDAMTIRSGGGSVFFATNGLVSGSSTVQVNFSGGRFIFVTLNAPTSGTQWMYSIGCPA